MIKLYLKILWAILTRSKKIEVSCTYRKGCDVICILWVTRIHGMGALCTLRKLYEKCDTIKIRATCKKMGFNMEGSSLACYVPMKILSKWYILNIHSVLRMYFEAENVTSKGTYHVSSGIIPSHVYGMPYMKCTSHIEDIKE